MTTAQTDVLKGLQAWYASQCNGSWEHTYGIRIDTLDNPGWSLKVNIVDTPLRGRSFDERRFVGQEDDDWYVCRIQDCLFEGACGPNRLNDVISVFLDWANAPASP
jgi:hypothetical protein